MSTTLSVGQVFLAAAGFAILFAIAYAVVGAIAAQLSMRAQRSRALEALYTEMNRNTAALERWSFDAAKARRDGQAAAFTPCNAVFGSLGATLHALPKPTLEKALDFYAALASLERLSIQATTTAASPADLSENFWKLRHNAEAAAQLGRSALFSFEIEGAVPAIERPKAAIVEHAHAALNRAEQDLKLATAA